MKAIRTTKIKLETRESRFIRFGREISMYCAGCLSDTRHMPVAQMASLLATTEKAIFRLTESGELHSSETDEGHLIVCMDSAAPFEPPRAAPLEIVKLSGEISI